MRIEPDDPSADWTAAGVYEVAAGLYRIPLPLPSDGLRAVNVYALRDGDRLTMIDAGWSIPEARALLDKAVTALGHGLGDVHRFPGLGHRRAGPPLDRPARRLGGTVGVFEPAFDRLLDRLLAGVPGVGGNRVEAIGQFFDASAGF